MDEETFKTRLGQTAAAVERVLEDILAIEPKFGESTGPRRLIEAMRYATLGGGKRLRPFLAIETARALGRTGELPVRAGAAIECVHAYSLIHDDLPAMDDDDLRRGRPTAHRAFDEATAILAGDALQTLAFEILADPRTDPDAETRACLCAGLARAAGLAGMVGGQMLDIEAETAAAPLSLEAIARLQSMKTGALLKFSVEAGAAARGRGHCGARGVGGLWPHNWRGVPDRRRSSRRGRRRDDAGKALRQGRRASQGDARRSARNGGRACGACPLGRRGEGSGRCSRRRGRGRRLTRCGRFRRGAKELRAPGLPILKLAPPRRSRRDSRGRARS